MSFNEFYKILIKSGCKVARTGKGSCIMLIGVNGNKFPFHNHGSKEINEYTRKGILKQAGLK